jgi:F0F1-type ATP synthase assembly protein I
MLQIAGTTGAVGLEIALAVAVGYLGGQYLDEKLGTTPWLKWIGFVGGVGAAIKALVRVNRSYKKSLEEDNKKNPPGSPPAPS